MRTTDFHTMTLNARMPQKANAEEQVTSTDDLQGDLKKEVDGSQEYLGGGHNNSSWGLRKRERQSRLTGLWHKFFFN